jgi:hypothetical protein
VTEVAAFGVVAEAAGVCLNEANYIKLSIQCR